MRESHEARLADLLEKMSDETPSSAGPQTVAFYAHRDAEKLEDPALVEIAGGLLQTEKRAERKRHLYFVLGHLGAKTHAAEVEALVRPGLAREKNGYTLAAALGALRRLPALQDASDVRALLKSKVPQVRAAAILALRGDRSGAAERDVLALLERTRDRFELLYAMQTLADIGGPASIPKISALARHRDIDVKCAAIAALAQIGGKPQQDVFLAALGDKNPAAKTAAMLALKRHGDARAVPKVAARVKLLLAKSRTAKGTEPDLEAGLDLLRRHRHLPEARDAVEEAKRLAERPT